MNLSKSKIKEFMNNKGIKTFLELSNLLGITHNQLSLMLSTSYSPFKSRVLELATILDVLPTELVDNEYKTQLNDVCTPEINSLEIFAGAGGLALGFEQAGIINVACVEIDKTCCLTLNYNRPHWNVICSDISTVDFTKYYNKVDAITGGFPCQAFSFAGKKMGFEDSRGNLFYEFARTVKEIQPKIFIAENVRGLLSHNKGETFKVILDTFFELGYRINYKILNAAYFGVAQKRERVVIVGIRNDLKGEFHFPEPELQMTPLKKVLQNCPSSPGVEYSEKKKEILKLVPPGGCWVNLPEDIAKNYMGKSYYSGGGRRGMARRISWDEPCLTLTCSPSQKQTERCHPDETRPFTIREYARIQSFPDEWTFKGGVNEQYQQIGNAVPVELARRIGVQVKKFLLSCEI